VGSTRTVAHSTAAHTHSTPRRAPHHTTPQVHNEAEIKRILPIAAKHGVPVTFRAAGTSLSGQAITDSVLLKLSHTGKNFRNYTIHVSVCADFVCLECARPVCCGVSVSVAAPPAAAAVAWNAARPAHTPRPPPPAHTTGPAPSQHHNATPPPTPPAHAPTPPG
jgi:hypothetical protein